jgi:hypothetical protein
MGVYDNLQKPDGSWAQVKVWDSEMRDYRIGDSIDGESGTYSIGLREGGFANIVNGVYESWTEEPTQETVIDKWGGTFDGTNYAENDPYLPSNILRGEGF